MTEVRIGWIMGSVVYFQMLWVSRMYPKHMSVIYIRWSHRKETIGDALGIYFAMYWDIMSISYEYDTVASENGVSPQQFTAILAWNDDKPVDFEVAISSFQGMNQVENMKSTRWNSLASVVGHIAMKIWPSEFRGKSRETAGQMTTALATGARVVSAAVLKNPAQDAREVCSTSENPMWALGA